MFPPLGWRELTERQRLVYMLVLYGVERIKGIRIPYRLVQPDSCLSDSNFKATVRELEAVGLIKLEVVTIEGKIGWLSPIPEDNIPF